MGTVGTMAARIDNLEKELRRALARNEQLAGVVHALRERVCKLEEFQNDSTYDLSAIQRELGMVFHPKKQSSESSDEPGTPGEDDGVELHDEDSDLPNPGEYSSSFAGESCDEVYDSDDQSLDIVEAKQCASQTSAAAADDDDGDDD